MTVRVFIAAKGTFFFPEGLQRKYENGRHLSLANAWIQWAVPKMALKVALNWATSKIIIKKKSRYLRTMSSSEEKNC